MSVELLKSYENQWNKLDKNEKLIQLGKLKMLEELKNIIEIYQESLTRDLQVNRCENEKDVMDGKEIQPNREYKDPEIISVKNL
tara:strand:- start:207 stop:458 length:252 start_codon:yes stop_codon:yes gene_type:complete